MEYVDGFVAAVPINNKQRYVDHIAEVAKMFKKQGALQYVECWAEDVKPGQLTSFVQAVHCKEDEAVVFSWISWPSKDLRDRGMAAVLQEYETLKVTNPMPFDADRLIYGGFNVLLKL